MPASAKSTAKSVNQDASAVQAWRTKIDSLLRADHSPPIQRMNDEAQDLIGQSRDSDQKDLFGAIAAGNLSKWELNIQLMNEEDAEVIAKAHLDYEFGVRGALARNW